MIFSLDENMIIQKVIMAFDDAESDISEEQFNKIAIAINDSVPGLISVLTRGMAEHWKQAAMDAGGWGNKYAGAISYTIDKDSGEIFLDDKKTDQSSGKPNMMFAKMVEEGMKSFSIKEGLMKSEHVKRGKNGVKYIVVPFPVAVPRGIKNMKESKQFGGREMTQEAHKLVKTEGKYIGALATGGDTFGSGLVRYTTRQFHEAYGMFICVNENSRGWIHPGVMANPVFPKVIEEVNKKIAELISDFCAELVKKYSK